MQPESRLAYRGTGGNNDQLSRLPAGRHAVQIGKPRRNTGDAFPIVCHTAIHQFQGVLHQLIHVAQVIVKSSFAFQVVGKVMQFHQCFRHIYRHVRGSGQQTVHTDDGLTPHVLLAQDGGVLLQVGRRGHARSQLRQPERPAHSIQFATGGKFKPYGDDVDALTCVIHGQQGGEYLGMALLVEHLRTEFVGNKRHGCRLQQAGAEDYFFQFGVVGIKNFGHSIHLNL